MKKKCVVLTILAMICFTVVVFAGGMNVASQGESSGKEYSEKLSKRSITMGKDASFYTTKGMNENKWSWILTERRS